MTQHTTLVKSYPYPDCAVTDADGWRSYLTRGDRFHLFAVCATAVGVYVAVLALVLSMKGA
ncbi:hypothetical protein [Azospirillum sp. TSO5]|uniref:hypothetical protein n=1 Tax=Azospirillum sp. TSO5 TaxID=716760 RepID=UPI000D64B722|nr:hypothetical protein [Azospirillum sp. TSO5]